MPTGRAAVLEDYGEDLKLWEVQVDDPGPGEVLVRMAYSGVCHTDEHVVTGDLPLPVPMVLGHEGAGVVEAIGPGVTRLRPGDRVVLSWLPACGRCQACRSGWTGMCRTTSRAAEKGTLWDGAVRVHAHGRPLSVMSLTGTLATYAVVPEQGAVAVDADVPLAQAALLGCSATTGYGAVAHAARLRPGASVTVIGVGGVGLHVVQASRLMGAERIFAVDRFPARLEAARRLGATDLVRVGEGEGDALVRILDATGGMGTDYAFEVVGTPATIAQAFNAVRPGGTAVVVGVAPPHEEVSLNAFAFPSQGKTLTGTWYGGGDLAEDVAALLGAQRAGRIHLEAFLGEPFPLERVNDAFAALRAGSATRPMVALGGEP
ncbi:MAG: alcohol dehydrogenase catalytic domain-containing protein [Firmicutes bacterium]|nr:alcohol dehydrogenase catalytic domain-containing protein [Bacillota bacterium]